MKIGIIGHLKFPIAKPFSGGLETFTHSFVKGLQRRGHQVTLYASGDSDESLPLFPIIDRATVPDSRRRLGRVDHAWVEAAEDEAYGTLMNDLNGSDFDVIHNHSLSPVPLRFASTTPVQLVTTIHAPMLPRIKEEIRVRGHERCGRFVNISRSNALAWRLDLPSQSIVHNGVDTKFWKADPFVKRQRAIWFGRILPEKGTHHAIDAAHLAGIPIDVIGPISDEAYFGNEVEPRLRPDDRFHGHLDQHELCRQISRSAVALATPCWDEPFGLVVAEALACGTPVAGFSRGALPEIVDDHVGRLVQPGDIFALAEAIRQCRKLNGDTCRAHVKQLFSFDRMIGRYETIYATMTGGAVPAIPTSAYRRIAHGGDSRDPASVAV